MYGSNDGFTSRSLCFTDLTLADGINYSYSKEPWGSVDYSYATMYQVPNVFFRNYDISFNLKEDKTENSEGFNMWGSKNAGREKISWNNNNTVTSNEESEQ